MNQAFPENQPIGNWYLFIGDGICLKVSSDLVLGEDEKGLVVLNPKQAGYGLLKIRKDDDGRLLLKNISRRHVLDWQKGSATMVGGEFALVAGSKIVLPNNELYLNHEMQRGQVSAHIIVQESEPAVEQVEVLVEVIPEALADKVVGPKRIEPATELKPAAEPVIAEKLLDQEICAEPRVPQAPAAETVASSGNNRTVLIAVAVSLCLVIGVLIGTWSSKPGSEPPAIVETPQPLTSPAEPAEIISVETPIAQSMVPESTPAEMVVVEPITIEPESEPVIELETAAEPEAVAETDLVELVAVDPAVAAGLARARAYLEQGFITQPKEGNAVMELSNILWQDPSNQAAFDLMGEATTRLIDAAVEAHAAGFEYEARNLIGEVLGFNPQHPQANAYKRQWSD